MTWSNISIDILIVGDEGVGKTNFVVQQTEKRFSTYNVPSVGVLYHKSAVTVAGETTLMEISDASGKECYKSHLPTFYNNADVVILMFDVTNKWTFENIKIWNAHLESNCSKGVCTFIVGNKKNTAGKRLVSEKEARRFSASVEATYFECCSHNLKTVEDIFKQIVLTVRKKWNSLADITMIPLYTPPNNFFIKKEPLSQSKSIMRYSQMWGSHLIEIADKQLNDVVKKLQPKSKKKSSTKK